MSTQETGEKKAERSLFLTLKLTPTKYKTTQGLEFLMDSRSENWLIHPVCYMLYVCFTHFCHADCVKVFLCV